MSPTLLAGLASGTTTLRNFSTGADCASSLGCVAALGEAAFAA